MKVKAVIALVACAGVVLSAQAPQQEPQSFKFRTGVELVNVNATVTDQSGRFVSGLTKDDFRIFDDEESQAVTHFSAERVPVSLGIVLDTSGSMDGDKMRAAKAALDRFLVQLLDPDDEVFLYRFDNNAELVEDWTRDKRRISESLYRIQPRGGTALYDAVADAVHMAQQGRNKKKAVVVISDGNDTSSRTDIFSVKQLIRETEVLVYAIGIDSAGSEPYLESSLRSPVGRESALRAAVGQRLARSLRSLVGQSSSSLAQRSQRPRYPIPLPFPLPGGRKPAPTPPPANPPTVPRPGGGSGGTSSTSSRRSGSDDRVNVAALRDITDDSGGRTEIIRYPRDLDPATAGIADELSKQYYLGYAAPGARDGRWHSIRLEVRNPNFHVRTRRGYVAGR